MIIAFVGEHALTRASARSWLSRLPQPVSATSALVRGLKKLLREAKGQSVLFTPGASVAPMGS